MFTLEPVNGRFKRLIKDFGSSWVTLSEPRAMPCFEGEVGVTASPVDNPTKVSNFRLVDVKL